MYSNMEIAYGNSRTKQHAHLLAGVVVKRLDGCIPLCLPQLPLLLILAVTQHPVPGKCAVAPVIAAAGKAAPNLQLQRMKASQ